MSLYTIGDLHLSLGSDKPMDVFKGWKNYVGRLEQSWLRLVEPEDTIVLAGDVSWGMSLEESKKDFAFIHALPGEKIILKGNHDYWWNSRAKMESFFEENHFTSIRILHNNCFFEEGVAICGTRGWVLEEGVEHDEKVMNREAGRLRTSLEAARKQDAAVERMAFLHYPPCLANGSVSQDLIDILHEYDVKKCYFGHLHGPALRWAVQGMWDDICYKLISADSISFVPYKIH